jgi:two-component system invasion response regulator UvrY
MITVQIIGVAQLPDVLDDNQLKIIARHTVGADGLNYASQYKPDIILLDYTIPMDHVLIIVNLLLQESPRSKIILISEGLSDELIIEYLANGVYGYLPHNTLKVFLIKAVKAVHSGEAWISRKIAALLIVRLRG